MLAVSDVRHGERTKIFIQGMWKTDPVLCLYSVHFLAAGNYKGFIHTYKKEFVGSTYTSI